MFDITARQESSTLRSRTTAEDGRPTFTFSAVKNPLSKSRVGLNAFYTVSRVWRWGTTIPGSASGDGVIDGVIDGTGAGAGRDFCAGAGGTEVCG